MFYNSASQMLGCARFTCRALEKCSCLGPFPKIQYVWDVAKNWPFSEAPRWADAASLTSDHTLSSTVPEQIKITELFGCIPWSFLSLSWRSHTNHPWSLCDRLFFLILSLWGGHKHPIWEDEAVNYVVDLHTTCSKKSACSQACSLILKHSFLS